MPKAKCRPCMGAEVKAAILDQVADLAIKEMLARVPDCPDPRSLDLCLRRQSPYQAFVSTCMKAKNLKGLDPEAMKDCARQWRERKN